MRPEVDQSICIGDGICADICPEVFELKDDNLAYVINENPGEDLADRVVEAADACPTTAIIVHDT